MFLDRMQKYFDVVVFSASLKEYCDMIMDQFDPQHKIRRYNRNHCISQNGIFIKDLRVVCTDMKNVIIMDNSPVSFML